MQQIQGTHLLVDGYVSSRKTLTMPKITAMFDELVTALDMQYLTSVQSAEVPLNKESLETEKDEGGFSVYCQITTSHISAHIWPLRKAVMLDVFSCIPFDFYKAFKIIDGHLKFKHYSTHNIKRTDPLYCQLDGRQIGSPELDRDE